LPHALTAALQAARRFRGRDAVLLARRIRLYRASVPCRGTLGAIALAGWATLATPVIARPTPAPNLALESGSYSANMLIGADPATHTVSGYYEAYSGQKKFSCVFALIGKLRGRSTPIQTYFPGDRSGVIRGVLVKSTRRRFAISLAAEHGGCWNVQHFSDAKQPAQFELRAAYPWILVAVVKRPGTYLLDSIGSGSRQAVLNKGDGVGVRAVRRQWLQVDFISGRKPVTGWIRQSDVYSSPRPR
jgi:hypothetical protein